MYVHVHVPVIHVPQRKKSGRLVARTGTAIHMTENTPTLYIVLTTAVRRGTSSITATDGQQEAVHIATYISTAEPHHEGTVARTGTVVHKTECNSSNT